MQINFKLNGKPVSLAVTPDELLSDVVRERLDLTGTHVGCDTSQCGACVVHVDGLSVKSCTTLAITLDGASVTTIEGLTPSEGLSPLQQAFCAAHAMQCGFCTPGMIVAATELLRENPAPSAEQIREALSGNLCMCTGYVNIVRAVTQAAAAGRGAGTAGPAVVEGGGA